jgi:hypothetical protein
MSKAVKGLLEIQERNGRTMLEVGEKKLGIK